MEPTLAEHEMAGLDELARSVSAALLVLPAYFDSRGMHFPVLEASKLPGLGGFLSHSIESQAVAALNMMRAIWDPGEDWGGYSFERQAQTFPDVRLVRPLADGLSIALGIELKGWYLLAAEGVPTFRFKVTRDACAEHDLIAVYPWHLDSMVSGGPVLRRPWVYKARLATEARNEWWQRTRKTENLNGISSPRDARPYPPPGMKITDIPASDPGSNFGRLARVPGLMKEYAEAAKLERIAGIAARDWVRFLKHYAGEASYRDDDDGSDGT